VKEETAIIIGAGPAGLTAALELLEKTKIRPVILEMTGDIGGISKTVNYKGNRIDIGGHRFFSKSAKVREWWNKILPLQGAPSRDDELLNRQIPLSKTPNAPDPEKKDEVMLIRSRLSRIYYLKRFFDYPVAFNWNTFRNLGFFRILFIGFSYLKTKIFPIRNENSLEDFFINRFGKRLYQTFFKDYTEKVWGIPCGEISKDWGAQRIKGLSLTKALFHALKSLFIKDASLSQKNTETSLIEQFLYPKYGPGQLWEEAAKMILAKGGEIRFFQKVVGLEAKGNRVEEVIVKNEKNGETEKLKGDYFFSTMAVKDLIHAFNIKIPQSVLKIADGLKYRDFITVGLLLKKLKIKNQTNIKTLYDFIPDNWIYIQEREVKVGRLQFFNNWSPYMASDQKKAWLGLEYFCNEGDELWNQSDPDFTKFAVRELASIGIIEEEDVLDSVVIRVPKTYPAYFGTYQHFDLVKTFFNSFENLFLIGRNGMHRYNNMDHSMLSAMAAVENIKSGILSKDNIWAVNAEEDYHEEKKC
jgi:protoporphyrinogen oxidase